MTDQVKLTISSQGWQQIRTARDKMLASYDEAREHSKARRVQVHHGNVAEGALRKWLEDFLPKRYGVTSGYVVSQGVKNDEKTPHFDVIIYDRLESPVLWIESNPDNSEQGKARAIPVEYVHAILEVKAAFSTATAQESIDHLTKLSPLMQGVDKPDEPYKVFLPPTFCCGLVFFELRQADAAKEDGLIAIANGATRLRRFFGGLILRGEGHTDPLIGRIELAGSETPITNTFGSGDKKTLLDGFHMSTSIQISEKEHLVTVSKWTESAFAQFAFDLIAMMKGTYRVGRVSSFYGIGTSRPVTKKF